MGDSRGIATACPRRAAACRRSGGRARPNDRHPLRAGRTGSGLGARPGRARRGPGTGRGRPAAAGRQAAGSGGAEKLLAPHRDHLRGWLVPDDGRRGLQLAKAHELLARQPDDRGVDPALRRSHPGPERPHQALDYRSPLEYRARQSTALARLRGSTASTEYGGTSPWRCPHAGRIIEAWRTDRLAGSPACWTGSRTPRYR